MPRTKDSAPELTASAFAGLVGANRHDILKKLNEMEAKAIGERNGGKTFSLRDLVNAHMGGDEKAARIRKLQAETEKLDVYNLRTKGELVPVATVKKLGGKVMSAIKIKILNMPLTDDEKDQILSDLLSLKNLDFSEE